MKNTGDYSVHMCEPDHPVDWTLIEEIQIETLEAISCPICLYEPVAGKMTKCGHIYCWPCVLHYLSLSDKSWRKCPICFESIYKADLKSVRVLKHELEHKAGESITMTLMFKHKSQYSTIILPASMQAMFEADVAANCGQVTYDLFNGPRYADARKYFKMHSRSAQAIYADVAAREEAELNAQAEADQNQPEVCFVTEALVLLEEREAQLKAEIEKQTGVTSQSSSSGKNKSRAFLLCFIR